MAQILSDRELRPLLGTVVVGALDSSLNPNGVELRLGKDVLFHSTGEEAQLEPGQFLRVNPGETVTISSHEQIDFSRETVEAKCPGCMLMGVITPTTTMMREGISQVATKVDAGFKGALNWGLRNGSGKPLVIEYGEPIFKLTVFRLEGGEVPEVVYGERTDDKYQDTTGIRRSKRRIPADIPASRVVASSFEKLDPKKQLREAGYPFDYIGTELITLHGKFEVVSKDVALLRDQLNEKTAELSGKIERETSTLSSKIEENRKTILDRVEVLFERKFYRAIGVIVGATPLLYGGLVFLQQRQVPPTTIGFVAATVGIAVLALAWLVSRRAA